MTTIFYILIAFCLFFEVLNLAACKKFSLLWKSIRTKTILLR